MKCTFCAASVASESFNPAEKHAPWCLFRTEYDRKIAIEALAIIAAGQSPFPAATATAALLACGIAVRGRVSPPCPTR